jgi:hypothetical protein
VTISAPYAADGKEPTVASVLVWRGTIDSRYRLPVATVMPLTDRRARLAFLLAALGLPSLGITVPAAIWLGVSSVRQRRLSSGGEPAMGFIALVLSGLDVMMLNPVLLRSFEIVDPLRMWTGIGWGVALAAAAALCTASTLRIHPERWGALLVARAGLIGAMAGGTALFVRLITVLD